MPNGGQTGDPCVLLTFSHTGLVGEGSVGRRIVYDAIQAQFELRTSWTASVLKHVSLTMRRYQYNTSPLLGISFPSQIAFTGIFTLHQGVKLSKNMDPLFDSVVIVSVDRESKMYTGSDTVTCSYHELFCFSSTSTERECRENGFRDRASFSISVRSTDGAAGSAGGGNIRGVQLAHAL
jgi:hypothetical protein